MNATDTCGEEGANQYCVISSLDARSNKKNEKCALCDSTDPENSHEVSSIVDKFDQDSKQLTWWQASNGKGPVSITLDLEAEFHVTHVIVTFKTFRLVSDHIMICQ